MFLSEIEKYLFFCEIIDFFRVATKKRQIEKSNENIYRDSEIYINILGSTRTQQKWSSNDLSSHLESELDELKINKSCLPCSRRRLEQWDQWAYLHYETRERESTSDNSKQNLRLQTEKSRSIYACVSCFLFAWNTLKEKNFPFTKNSLQYILYIACCPPFKTMEESLYRTESRVWFLGRIRGKVEIFTPIAKFKNLPRTRSKL